MKKISIYSCAMLCAMITNTSLPKASDVMPDKITSSKTSNNTTPQTSVPPLRKFETAKNDALAAPNKKASEAKEELDGIIEKVTDVLAKLKTLRAAHVSLAQHEAVGHATEDALRKTVTGKTIGKVSDYRAQTELGDSKAKSERTSIGHFVDKLGDRVDGAIKISKQNLAEDKKKHDSAQDAVSQPDAEKPVKMIEEKKEKTTKEPKEKKEKTSKKAKKRKTTTASH